MVSAQASPRPSPVAKCRGSMPDGRRPGAHPAMIRPTVAYNHKSRQSLDKLEYRQLVQDCTNLVQITWCRSMTKPPPVFGSPKKDFHHGATRDTEVSIQMPDARHQMSDVRDRMPERTNLSSDWPFSVKPSVGSVISACLRRSEAPASRRQVVRPVLVCAPRPGRKKGRGPKTPPAFALFGQVSAAAVNARSLRHRSR